MSLINTLAARAASRRVCTLALLLASTPALAHGGHAVDGFVAGLLHPFTGLDHLLAMLAVGWWSALTASKRWWAIPLAFAASLLLGALVGIGQAPFAATEFLIAASLMVFGASLLLRAKVATWFAAVVAAAFAFAHGLAHGNELPADDATAWLAGMLAATLALHLGGAIAGRLTRRHATWATPVTGAVGIGAGLMFAAGLVTG